MDSITTPFEDSSTIDSATSAQYEYSSTTIEDTSTIRPQTTWGVAFNYRPSVYYMKHPGLFWKLVLSRRANHLHSVSPHSPAGIPGENATNIDIPAVTAGPFDDTVDLLSEKMWIHLFATVNSNHVHVYVARTGQNPLLIRRYKEPNEEESYYTVTWTYNADGRGNWWVLCAGETGIIRVIDVSSNSVVRSLVGHGNSVNDIAVHPKDPALILSASKDESVRLWNLRTGATVAVFAGVKGHRGDVVSVDFDRDGKRFASCGIDYSIRVWDILGDNELVYAIADSHHVTEMGTNDPYMFRDAKGDIHKTKFYISQFPLFANRKVHKNYVDKIVWLGDFLLSKSVHNRLLLTRPDLRPRESLATPNTEFKIMEEYIVNGHKPWFIRFGLDRGRRNIAIGNVHEGISVYDIQIGGANPTDILKPPKSGVFIGENYVRQCAFSNDGAIIISVDDKSRVIQYDRVGGTRRKHEPEAVSKLEDIMVE